MSKSIKFKNNTYMDTSGIVHGTYLLSEIISNLLYGSTKLYHPADMSAMGSGVSSQIIDTSKSHVFSTDWKSYSSYDSRFAGVLGIYIKGADTSTGGMAVIFFYNGSIGVNIRIDSNRWGGWRWIC